MRALAGMRTRYVVLLGLAAFCAGVVAGEFRARHVFKPYLEIAQIAYGAALSEYVDVQHQDGTPEAYEASLRDFLHGLDVSDSWPMEPYPRRFQSFDRLLTYTRLARSQAARGATEESQRSMQAAIAACNLGKWKACTEEHLQAMVKELDERHAKRLQQK